LVKAHWRKAQSNFRCQLDCIRSELFYAFSRSNKQIRKLLSLLSPAPPALSAKGLPVTIFVMYRENQSILTAETGSKASW
jgi:hypothetical protein